MAGDFNANLDSTDSVVDNICAFTKSHNLLRCDDLFPSEKHPIYVNEPLNRESYIDYIFVSRECQVNKFSVSDPDINFSDHLPLLTTVSYIASPAVDKTKAKQSNGITTQMQLRWDWADIGSFYNYSGDHLLSSMIYFLVTDVVKLMVFAIIWIICIKISLTFW